MGVAAHPETDWRRKMIAGLLDGQQGDGSFGVHPYSKWNGAHWRLISLVELGIPPKNRAARAAANTVLDWIAQPSEALVIAGKERRHASMEGNALAVCCRLGMAHSLRVRRLVNVLLRSQWPDGGWNCDENPDARRSSFHESLAPIWGLVEYHRATADGRARKAARRAGELLLEHGLFRSLTTREVIHPEWLHIHWPHYWHYDFFHGLRAIAMPHYWHYDFFHGLRAIAMLGMLADARADEALDALVNLRRPDGTWRASGRRYWTLRGDSGIEVVDWADAHEIVTAAALAMLQ